MWKAKNIYGEEITWYSKEEYGKLKQALEEIKDYCIKTTSRPLERKFILTIICEVLND